MHKVRRLRAMGSMCRQQAAYDPAQRGRFIAEAEYWEKLADFELAAHYEECNAHRSAEANIAASAIPKDTGWETIVAA
jgi:hypothetical protein